jgi:hypothetical protein
MHGEGGEQPHQILTSAGWAFRRGRGVSEVDGYPALAALASIFINGHKISSLGVILAYQVK